MPKSLLFLCIVTTFLHCVCKAEKHTSSTGSGATECSAGSLDNSDELSIICKTDTNGSPVPFPKNLAQLVSAVQVYDENISDTVTVDRANVKSLTYVGNAPEVPDNAFGSFKNLQELVVDFSDSRSSADPGASTPPVRMGSKAFAGLPALRRLEIFGTNLSSSSDTGLPKAVSSLSNLQSLKLENTDLSGRINSKDLQPMKQLRTLEITNCPGLAIADDAFANVADTLEKLTLINVKMTTLPKSVSALKALQILRIQMTQLNALPGDMLRGSANTIKEIDLSNNAITSMQSSTFKGLGGVTILDLSFNGLSSLPSGVFDDLTSLKTLSLAGNQLTTAAINNAFKNLHALTVLNLANNHLDSVTATGVEDTLTTLDLGGNRVQSMKGVKFSKAPTVILDNNNITTLGSDFFEQGSTFSSLSINGNPLTSIGSNAFTGLSAGPSFGLASTAATVFDLSSLAGMRDLVNFTLSNNDDLRAVTVSSESAVPATLKNVIFEGNARYVLTDPDGKLTSFLQKNGMRFIFTGVTLCHCQMGWLRDKQLTKNGKVIFVKSGNDNDEPGDLVPARCCNVEADANDYVGGQFQKYCAGAKGKKQVTENDRCTALIDSDEDNANSKP